MVFNPDSSAVFSDEAVDEIQSGASPTAFETGAACAAHEPAAPNNNAGDELYQLQRKRSEWSCGFGLSPAPPSDCFPASGLLNIVSLCIDGIDITGSK